MRGGERERGLADSRYAVDQHDPGRGRSRIQVRPGERGLDPGQLVRPADEVGRRGGRLLDRGASHRPPGLPLLLPQHRELGVPEPLSRIDAELVGQCRPDPLVRRQRLRLPAARGQRQDQLGVQRLVQLVPECELPHRPQCPLRPAQVAGQGGECLDGGGVLAGHRGVERARRHPFRVDLAAPQGDGRGEPGQRLLRRVVRRPRREVAELQQVELIGGEREPVPVLAAEEHARGAGTGVQQPPQPGDVRVQQADRAPARATRRSMAAAVGPQELDELVLPGHRAGAEGEPGEQRALQVGAERRLDLAVPDLDRAEYADAQRAATGRIGFVAPDATRLCGGVQLLGVGAAQPERAGDGLDGVPFRASRPALFQVADRARAHARPLGELPLGQPGTAAMGAQQPAEAGPRHSCLHRVSRTSIHGLGGTARS